jgi:hypothetical protein
LKFKELIYLLGIRPKPKEYSWALTAYDFPDDGHLEYAWQHPIMDPCSDLGGFGRVKNHVGSHRDPTCMGEQNDE